ncbi:hypothetical protein [Moorena producens]|uniref:hypothetical protein n=1 Tax=Moorena producens TaxID=1155739 RepID=UPI003C723610
MNFSELKTALGIENHTIPNDNVTISKTKFTENIDTLIEYCYENQFIVISNAQYVSENTSNNTVTISGKSSFIEVVDLDVEAQFWIDEQDEVQLSFKYLLRGEMPGANAWYFTRSFPQLPTVVDNAEPTYFNRKTQEIRQTLVAPLDKVYFFNSYFIVVSQPQTEPNFQVDLQWGINFVSSFRPQGYLGAIENLFNSQSNLTIYGTIRKPLPTETPQNFATRYSSVERFLYPWTVADNEEKGLQGILLQVDLGLDYNIIQNKIEFKADKLYFYTPLTNDWLLPNTNPAFVPIQAYTGSIELPGAGIKVDMVVPIQVGIDELTILGSFEGVSLSNLAQLVGLTGSDDNPLDSLPDEIQAVGDQLGKLELINTSVSIDYTDLQYVTVSHTTFTIGMPDLKWQVWDDDFEIDSIYCTFDISYPFSTPADAEFLEERVVDITVYGNLEIENVPFSVYASSLDGYAVYAEMGEAQTLPLTRIMEKYAHGISPPSDLTINIFRIGIAPRREYSMALAMAQEPTPWVIDLGPESLTVEDVALGFSYPQGGPISGSVSGSIALADFAKLAIVYDTPGDIIMRSMIPEVSLMQLVGVLTDKSLALPDAFDIDFTNSSVLIQKQAQNYIFQLATEVENFGSLAFQVQRVGAQWGFAAGFNMAAGTPSDISGLGGLGKFISFFALNRFLLVVASFDAPNFTFPDLAAFNNPTINAKEIALPAHTQGIIAGLNIFAEWTFDNSQQQQLLKKFLGIGSASLAITLQVGKNPSLNSKLFASTSVKVGGLQLNAQFGGLIANGELGLFLTGQLIVPIQGNPYKFSVTLLFVANGAFLSGTMTGVTAIDFDVFKLSNLALEVGINWQGIPSLGIAGTIDVETFQSSIALFFNSANPSKSLVAGSLSDLTLKDVLETFAGDFEESDITDVLDLIGVEGTRQFEIPVDVVDDLDNLNIGNVSAAFANSEAKVQIPSSSEQVLLVVNTPGSVWYLTDRMTMIHYQLYKRGNTIEVSRQAQLYIAPQSTFIGDIRFEEGFFVSGALQLLLFRTETNIEIRKNKGIAIDTYMDPIVIGTEKLFSLKAFEGDGGPRLSVATFTQPDHEIEDFKLPHFYINGQLQMLGISREAFVTLTKNGFEFYLGGDLVLAVHGEIHGHFKGLTDMAAGGSLDVEVGTIDLGPLGKIPINTGVNGSLDITVDKDSISVTFDANFKFAGKTHKIAKFDIDVKFKQLTDLAEMLYEKVKDLLSDIFKDVEEWAKAVGDKLIEGVTDPSGVLEREFGLSPEAADEIVKRFGLLATVCATTTALASL